MSFKNFHISVVDSKLEQINEVFENLFEASEGFYNLTSNGKMQFEKSFQESPEISKATNLQVLNLSNEDDKQKIIELKKKGFVRFLMYVAGNSRIMKPSTDSDHFLVPKEFFTFTTLKPSNEQEKSLLKSIKEKESQRTKTSKDITAKVSEKDIITFVDILKNSSPTKYSRGVYYVYDRDTKKLYEIIYNKKDSKFSFDQMFSESAPYQGEESGEKFKISPAAQELEDVQVLGVYFDANKMLSEINSFEKSNPKVFKPYEISSFRSIIKPFEKALTASNELRDFNKIIQRDYKNFGYDDWKGICYLAGGMSDFVKDVVKEDAPYIVFKSRSEFKKLEAERFAYDLTEDGKHSTADLIISTVPKEKLFELMKDKSVSFEFPKGMIKIEDENGKPIASFWQVNIKHTLDSSVIGRSQKYFSKLYNMIVGGKEVFESYETLTESFIEKLSDVAKKGAKFVKDLGKKLYDKIRFVILALKDYSQSIRSKISKSTSQNAVQDALELFGIGMNEAVKNELNEIIADLQDDPKKHYDRADLNISKLCNSLIKMNNPVCQINYESPKEINKPTSTVFKKQIFIYSFLKAFKNVVLSSKNPLEKYVDELLGFYIEASFGATRMPLWRVYSNIGGHISYELLGTKDSAKEERKGNILKGLGKEGLPVIILNIKKSIGVNELEISILSNIISENGKFDPKYVLYKIGFSENLEADFIAVQEYSPEKALPN
jgi:hypothetical protein